MWNTHKIKKKHQYKRFKKMFVLIEMTGIKYGFLSKHLFQRTHQHGGSNKYLDIDEFIKKTIPCTYHIE